MTTTSVSDDLRRTVTAAADRLRGMDERTVSLKPAPSKWSRKEILGHLVDSAGNNHQRFVRAQLASELRFPKYEQDGWVSCQDYLHVEWESLITLWLAYNLHLAHIIARIPADKLDTPCRIGEYDVVTLGFLAEDYLEHLKHHLRQMDG